MNTMTFVGMDVHKKTISICGKNPAGKILFEEVVPSRRADLRVWAEKQRTPWRGVLEATLFTGWIFDFLKPYARELVVGNPLRLKAICAGKKKTDRLDARTLADLLRCNLVPEVYMMPEHLRELRRVLRYRNLLVRESVRFRNRAAGLLLETGTEFTEKDLRSKKRFNAMVDNIEDVPTSVRELLRQSGSNRDQGAEAARRSGPCRVCANDDVRDAPLSLFSGRRALSKLNIPRRPCGSPGARAKTEAKHDAPQTLLRERPKGKAGCGK